MQTPSWVQDLSAQMVNFHQQTQIEDVDFRRFEVNESFDTMFAQWELRDGDLIVQLFPRHGVEDTVFPGHYINVCRNCKRETEIDRQNPLLLKACKSCGHTGLVYKEGRLEQKVENLTFPEGFQGVIANGANEVWEGEVQWDFVPELEAYCVKFVGAGTISGLADNGGLLDRFLAHIDKELTDGRTQ